MPSLSSLAKAQVYQLRGRVPWSPGYLDYRDRVIAEKLADSALLDAFLRGRALPDSYGVRLDERIVEYPWVYARLADAETRLLDAGSTLARPVVLAAPRIRKKHTFVYTLLAETLLRDERISYIHSDLRHNVFQDAFFDEITCVSTIEHIGLDNTQRDYSADARYKEDRPGDDVLVMREFYRVLKPGGSLLLTVPYGKRLVYDWMQQYDQPGLARLIAAFEGKLEEQCYYRYDVHGWQVSDAAGCADVEYFNVHQRTGFDPDYAAAARGVACLRFSK